MFASQRELFDAPAFRPRSGHMMVGRRFNAGKSVADIGTRRVATRETRASRRLDVIGPRVQAM